MAKKFNPVPSETLHAALTAAGFTKTTSGKEIVFERANHNISCLKVVVYTSAHIGKEQVAACGKDAIRTVLIYTAPDGSTRCVKKGTRVFRVGETEAIIKRMMDRARELYGIANDLAKRQGCTKCGAPRWASGSCTAYCWKTNNKVPAAGKGVAA